MDTTDMLAHEAALIAPDPADLVSAENVYDIADMLLQGDSTEPVGGDENEGGQGESHSAGHSQAAGDNDSSTGGDHWVNPLASIQSAYSVEPQTLLQEMLDPHALYYGGSGVNYGTRQTDDNQGPRIIQMSPLDAEKLTSKDEGYRGSFAENEGKTVEESNSKQPASDLVSILTNDMPPMQAPNTASKANIPSDNDNLLPFSVKSEPPDGEYYASGSTEEYEEVRSRSNSPDISEDTDEDTEASKPQYNIVSLDPTAFPDAKVKNMTPLSKPKPDARLEKKVGRRSQSKHMAKPRKLLEGVDPTKAKHEPPAKKQKKDNLKLTINLRDIKQYQPQTADSTVQEAKPTTTVPVVQKRGRGRPRTRPVYVKTGRPRGRPPKSGRPAQPKPPKAPVIKKEPTDDGYDDEVDGGGEEVDMDASDTYIPHRVRRRRRPNARSVKGTHTMHYREYRCFECADDKEYISKDAFLEHWKSQHFVLEEDGANLYCSHCGAKYSVYLQRFHRATDVLQYISFYFNHKLKRHGMEAPSYIEEMRCDEPDCYYKAYTSYGLSRHLEEGKHRLRPPRSYRVMGRDGLPKALPLDNASYSQGQGNKYSLIFKEFKCYVCNDDKPFIDANAMLDHWRDNHFHFTEAEAIIQCGYCEAKYKVPRSRFHRQTDTMQYIAYFFSHLVKRHGIAVPNYIEQLQCSMAGCKFVTYTKQLLQRHLQEVKHITLSRTPALDGQEPSGPGPGMRSPYLSFKEYKCFLCVDEAGQHAGPYENGAVYAEHWRHEHFYLEENKVYLRCTGCPMIYQIQVTRFPRNADVLAVIARFFTHMVKKHSLEPPPYIEQLLCSVPGCEYKCFTPQILDGHRMTKRDPAHMGVLEALYASENMPTLSLRHLSKGHGSGTVDGAEPSVSPEKTSPQKMNAADESQDLASEGTHQSGTTDASPAKQEMTNVNDATNWNSDIASLSKHIAEGVLKGLDSGDVAVDTANTQTNDLDSSIDVPVNQTGASLEECIDTSDMKAKSLLCFTEIRCFECNNGKVYENHNDYANHWRSAHFEIGSYEVFIPCSQCSARIGLNKPLWHRDHDIGRCIASYLTHCMKKHKTECPDYVKELECPEPGCGYQTLTVKHMQFHVRHTKHHKLEKAKRLAAGLDPNLDSREVIRRSSTFRVNDNGLTFKEYQCFLCRDGTFYKTCMEYEAHWRQHHTTVQDDKDCLRCHVCGATFISHLYPSIAFLFCHLVKKHDVEVPWYVEEYTCEEEHCNYVTYTKALLAKHKQGQRHASGTGIFQYYLNFNEYRCFLCPAPTTVFPSKKVFENHLMDSHTEKCGDGSDYLRCPDCNHHFTLHHCKKPELNYDKPDPSRTLCVLFNHIVVKHKWEIPPYVVSFECPHKGCNFVTVRKYTLDRHVASHTADQQCYQCGMFFSKTRIEKHVKKCLSGKPSGARPPGMRSYPCSECGVSMVQKKALQRHMQEQHGKIIDDTSSSQGSSQKYKKPKASESGMAYKCDECGKILLEKKSMRRHLQSVHMQMVEPNQLSAIKHEAKVEDGPKHYECMLCGVQMNLMKSVKRHMMKQHGIKVGVRDLESSYVRVDPDAPTRPYAGVALKRKEKVQRKVHEYHMSHDLTTIDDSEISDFTSATQQPRVTYTVASSEAQLPMPTQEQHANLIEMTSVPHHLQTLQRAEVPEPLKVPTQQSIFPTPKPVPSISIQTSTNQALDFSMRITELEAGEIHPAHRLELLSHRLMPPAMPPPQPSPQLVSQPGSTEMHQNAAIVSAAARHLHVTQADQMAMSTERIELLAPRAAMPQVATSMGMGIMSGTVHPRDVLPMDFRMGVAGLQQATNDLLSQRLATWNVHNQS